MLNSKINHLNINFHIHIQEIQICIYIEYIYCCSIKNKNAQPLCEIVIFLQIGMRLQSIQTECFESFNQLNETACLMISVQNNKKSGVDFKIVGESCNVIHGKKKKKVTSSRMYLIWPKNHISQLPRTSQTHQVLSTQKNTFLKHVMNRTKSLRISPSHGMMLHVVGARKSFITSSLFQNFLFRSVHQHISYVGKLLTINQVLLKQ